MEIRLETRSGDFVAIVHVLPYRTPPDIVVWGERTFILAPQGNRQPHVYREGFATHAYSNPPRFPAEGPPDPAIEDRPPGFKGDLQPGGPYYDAVRPPDPDAVKIVGPMTDALLAPRYTEGPADRLAAPSPADVKQPWSDRPLNTPGPE